MTDLLKVLGQKYVVEVLLKIHEMERARFSDLKGLAKHPAAISRVLKKLKNEGMIERKVLDDEDRSVEYRLTERGLQFVLILRKLQEI